MSWELREASAADVPGIVALLADDPLGRTREMLGPELAPCYSDAFAAIDADPHQRLLVATKDGEVVGTLQLTFLPGLARSGAWRGQVEAVRVAAALRGSGLGRAMFDWAETACRAQGCSLMQLTSDVARSEAHAVYERLGFVASHVGFKRAL